MKNECCVNKLIEEEMNKTKEGLLTKINLIESITILENGSSYTEFNRCYCSEDLAYIKQEYAKAKRLSKKGEKLVYIPERNRKNGKLI